MSIYHDNFKSWADVSDCFSGTRWNWDEPKETIKEPEEVLFAAYNTPSYEGYATVLYRNDDKFYVVEGSHCSCYGLEGQWNPEEYESKELLIAALRRNGSWEWRGYGREMMKALGEEVPPEKEAA